MNVATLHTATRPLCFAALAMGAVAFLQLTTSAKAALAYATNGASLARFDTSALGTVTTVPVTGLQAGETLVGIDVRPANSVLYGVGSSSRMYSLNPLTGAATQVGAAGAFTLNGTAFGMDFNPIPDRIRHVSNTEQNLRLNPNDGNLSATDTTLNPAGNIVGTAYANNFPGTATTSLYALDSAAGTLVLIGSLNGTPNSPNGGLVSTIGSLGLGTNLNEAIGFDISGVTGQAMATLTTGGISRLYSVDLATGAATLQGPIGTGTTPFLGFTFATIPEPSIALLLTLGSGLFVRRRRLGAAQVAFR